MTDGEPSLCCAAAAAEDIQKNAVLMMMMMMMMMRKKLNSHFSLSLSPLKKRKEKKSILRKLASIQKAFLTPRRVREKKISHLHHNVVQIDSQTGTYSSSKFSNFFNHHYHHDMLFNHVVS